jgi:hypothetical protein
MKCETFGPNLSTLVVLICQIFLVHKAPNYAHTFFALHTFAFMSSLFLQTQTPSLSLLLRELQTLFLSLQ